MIQSLVKIIGNWKLNHVSFHCNLLSAFTIPFPIPFILHSNHLHSLINNKHFHSIFFPLPIFHFNCENLHRHLSSAIENICPAKNLNNRTFWMKKVIWVAPICELTLTHHGQMKSKIRWFIVGFKQFQLKMKSNKLEFLINCSFHCFKYIIWKYFCFQQTRNIYTLDAHSLKLSIQVHK